MKTYKLGNDMKHMNDKESYSKVEINWLVKEIPFYTEIKTEETRVNIKNVFGMYGKEDVMYINRED